tara:strand:+ start:175 stop:1047 length:873 start_codon:yes stop_codon:yes gene_type:complete
MVPDLGRANVNTNSTGDERLSPTHYDDLVGWWDFTDLSTMYTDAGTTNVSLNDDPVYRIDNKAYTLQGNTINAIGTFLENSSSGNRPLYKTATGGVNFDGTDDLLRATKAAGNVDTNKLSDTIFTGAEITVFFVVQHDATSVSADEYLFNMTGADVTDNMSVYVDDNSSTDRWQWHHQDDFDRTHTILNCTKDLTAGKELWTINISASPRFYRNGDSSDGGSTVTVNGSAGVFANDNIVNLSENDTDIQFNIGNGSLNGTVYEVLIYAGVMAGVNETRINNYLLHKHKLI